MEKTEYSTNDDGPETPNRATQAIALRLAAKKVGVSYAKLQQACKSGGLPHGCVSMGDNKTMITVWEEDVRKFLETSSGAKNHKKAANAAHSSKSTDVECSKAETMQPHPLPVSPSQAEAPYLLEKAYNPKPAETKPVPNPDVIATEPNRCSNGPEVKGVPAADSEHRMKTRVDYAKDKMRGFDRRELVAMARWIDQRIVRGDGEPRKSNMAPEARSRFKRNTRKHRPSSRPQIIVLRG